MGPSQIRWPCQLFRTGLDDHRAGVWLIATRAQHETGTRVLRFVGVICAAILLLPRVSAAQAEVPIPCPAEPTTMLVSYGALVACETGELPDQDRFAFAGSAGDRVVIRLAGESQCFRAVRLNGRAASGYECTSPTFNPVASTVIVLDDGDPYVILVDGTLSFSAYQLSLERSDPVPQSARPLCSGCTLSGAIEGPADIDAFRFDASVGDQIDVRLEAPAQVCFDLQLAFTTTSGCSPGSRSFVADRNGPFTVLVRGRSRSTIPFTISLTCVGECAAVPARCDLLPTAMHYMSGQPVAADVRVSSRQDSPVALEVKAWLQPPSGPAVGLFGVGTNGTFVVAPGQDITTQMPLDPAQTALRGLYALGCRVLDPLTAETLSEAVYWFSID